MCQNPSIDRAKTAQQETWPRLQSDLASIGIHPDSVQLYIRCFKLEEIVEIWTSNNAQDPFTLFRSYPFCVNSGELGPKRKEGDLQIPEGVYHINRFNPKSQFYLSLGINYPNQADMVHADQNAPGSDIFLHGKCSSVGCIAIGDAAIKVLYTLASAVNESSIRVDIFPYRLDQQVKIDDRIKMKYQNFWTNLKSVYLDFEQTKKLNAIEISESGEYIVNRD